MNKKPFATNKRCVSTDKIEDTDINKTRKLTKKQLMELNVERAKHNLLVGKNMTFVIICFELIMIVYSMIVFNFANVKHLTYFTFYCILLLASLPLFVCEKCMIAKKYNNTKIINLITYIYVSIIILWGIGISLLDMQIGNQSIVFLTVLAGATGVLLLPPKILLAVISVSIGLFLSIVSILKIDVSSGFIMNILIFSIIIFILCSNRYKNFIRDYKQRAELHLLNLQLDKMSKLDELTELLNRTAMNNGFESALLGCSEKKQPLSVFMFDLDDFKKINDTFGHKVGDECLKAVSLSLKNSVDQGDVYRYGGEEFAVIIQGIEMEDAIILGEKVIRQAATVKLPQYPDINLTLSGGLYCAIPEPESDTDDYIIRADRNLYAAKNGGKNKLIY